LQVGARSEGQRSRLLVRHRDLRNRSSERSGREAFPSNAGSAPPGQQLLPDVGASIRGSKPFRLDRSSASRLPPVHVLWRSARSAHLRSRLITKLTSCESASEGLTAFGLPFSSFAHGLRPNVRPTKVRCQIASVEQPHGRESTFSPLHSGEAVAPRFIHSPSVRACSLACASRARSRVAAVAALAGVWCVRSRWGCHLLVVGATTSTAR
jgi:hypothetical protein